VQYAFAGYSALSPLLWAAVFWKGSTKWGALAVTSWTALAVTAVAVFQALVPPPSGPPRAVLEAFGLELVTRTAAGTAVLGLLPVVPMVLVSALLMWAVSLLTRKPSQATLARYFD
jgi:Na+/proline symporter